MLCGYIFSKISDDNKMLNSIVIMFEVLLFITFFYILKTFTYNEPINIETLKNTEYKTLLFSFFITFFTFTQQNLLKKLLKIFDNNY